MPSLNLTWQEETRRNGTVCEVWGGRSEHKKRTSPRHCELDIGLEATEGPAGGARNRSLAVAVVATCATGPYSERERERERERKKERKRKRYE